MSHLVAETEAYVGRLREVDDLLDRLDAMEPARRILAMRLINAKVKAHGGKTIFPPEAFERARRGEPL